MVTGPLLVVGDAFLDADVDGSSRRLSPDAPVPVVDAGSLGLRPGGAGLAALLAARAGQEVVLVTALGHDEPAATLRRLLGDAIEVVALPLTGPTLVKTRIRSGGRPQLRLDTGDGRAAGDALPATATAAVERAVSRAGAVLVADYGRGVAGLPEVRQRLAAAAGRGVPVVWDPHPQGPAPVAGCRVVTPNAAEAAAATGLPDPADQGRRLCRSWRADSVAVTVGPRGAVLSEARSGSSIAVPDPSGVDADLPFPDTCGAGDQLAVTVAVWLRAGSGTRMAVQAGVRAASAFVRSGGVATVSAVAPVAGPPLSVAREENGDALTLAARVRAAGGRVVAAGGCFDLLHRGHVELLEHARSLGEVLVVCLNSDASVRRAKGPRRPLVPAEDRARVLLGLACVDAVVVFGEDTPVALLERLCPDVWVKGGDYAGQDLPEAAMVERHGGRVVLVPTRPGQSTSRLIRRAKRPFFSAHPTLEEVS